MEVIMFAGLVLLFGGLAIMALTVLFFVVVTVIALITLAVQTVWKATR